MAQFKNGIILQVFAMIYIVNADPVSIVDQCLSEILFAFGGNTKANGCMRFAIQYYIKGQKIKIEKDYIDLQNNILPSTLNSLAEQYIFPTLVINHNEDQNISNLSSKVTSAEDSCEEISGLPIPAKNVELPSSSQQTAKPRKNVTVLDYMSFHLEDLEMMDNETDDFEHRSKKIRTKNESQDDKNYATLYHEKLETMASGLGLPNRYEFCTRLFADEFKSCTDSLIPFGNVAKTAVLKAFSSYKLAWVTGNVYVHSYMKVLTQKAKTVPSKKPKVFCEDIEREQILAMLRNGEHLKK